MGEQEFLKINSDTRDVLHELKNDSFQARSLR